MRILTFSIIFLILSCKSDGTQNGAISKNIKLNPFGNAPLSAALYIDSDDENLTAQITIKSKSSQQEPLVITSRIEKTDDLKYFQVYGLYPDHENTIHVKIISENIVLDTSSHVIITPKIDHIAPQNSTIEGNIGSQSLILITESTKNGETSKSYMIDSEGNLRWFCDFDKMTYTISEFDDGLFTLGPSEGKNQNLFYQYNLVGQQLNSYDFSKKGKYGTLRSDIKKTKKGSFVLIADKIESESTHNYFIEYNKELLGNNVQLELNLEEILPNVDDLYLDLPIKNRY